MAQLCALPKLGVAADARLICTSLRDVRPLAPQFHQRRFGVPNDSERDKLQAALHKLENYGTGERDFSSGDEPPIVPPPPQVSRVSMGGLGGFVEKDAYTRSVLARPPNTTMTKLQQSTRNALKLHVPLETPATKTRSAVRRERLDLFRRLADKAHAKHHVLYDHHDHREYDRDIRRGIRGRGMVTPSKIDVPQSDHSFDSWSSSSSGEESYAGNDGSDEEVPRYNKIRCSTWTKKLEMPKEKWVEKYFAHHQHHRRDKYQHLKEILRQKLQHNLNHSIRHAQHIPGNPTGTSKEEVEVPNWIVNQIWTARKYWPLYRLRRNSNKLLTPGPSHPHYRHLHVHGHAALRRPKAWQPEDHLQHRYDALSQNAPADDFYDQAHSGHKVPHRLEEHMPANALHRHTHSMTDVVTHLLHADKKFEHLYNPSIKPPLVRVGKAMVPLNEEFIRRTSVVMNDPDFRELHKDPDETALVIAKLIQDAAKNGLVAAVKTMDSAPEAILGPNWNKALPEAPKQSVDIEDPNTRHAPAGPARQSEIIKQPETIVELKEVANALLPAEVLEALKNSTRGAPNGSRSDPPISSSQVEPQQRNTSLRRVSGQPVGVRINTEKGGLLEDSHDKATDRTSAVVKTANPEISAHHNEPGTPFSIENSSKRVVALAQERRVPEHNAMLLNTNNSYDPTRGSALDEKPMDVTSGSLKTNEVDNQTDSPSALSHVVANHAAASTSEVSVDKPDDVEVGALVAVESDYSLTFMDDRPMKYEEPVVQPTRRPYEWHEVVKPTPDTLAHSKDAPVPVSVDTANLPEQSTKKRSARKAKEKKHRSSSRRAAKRQRSSEPFQVELDVTRHSAVPTDPDFRTKFAETSAKLKLQQRAKMVVMISSLMETNSSFSEIVRQRILIQQRKQAQLEAQTRKVQYQDMPPVEVKKKKKAKKKKNKGKRRKKGKKPKRGALPASSQLPSPTLGSPPLARPRKSKLIGRRKNSIFQDVAVTRCQGRRTFFVPRTVVERTHALERRYEELRRRFEGVVDRDPAVCPTHSRSFGAPATSESAANANKEVHRANLRKFLEEPSNEEAPADTWKCVRTWLKFFPSDAEAYMKRASFEKIREPEQAIRDTSISFGIEDRLNRPEIGAAYLRRALCYFRMGQDYYDFAMGDLRTSVMLIGLTPQSALAFACYSFFKQQYFRAIAYFALALTILPVEEGARMIRYSASRALALLLFRTQQYHMAYEIWREASNIAMYTDATFFLFSGLCLRRMGERQKGDQYLRTFLTEASGSRTDALSTIYSNVLLDGISQAYRSLEQLGPLELLFDPKTLMFCARLFWTTGEFQKSAECARQCRQIRRFVLTAIHGIRCDNETLTFLDVLENVRSQSYDRAYELCQKGRLRWKEDLRFITWLAFLKFSQNLRWTRKPWASIVIEKISNHLPSNQFIWYARARCAYYNERDVRKALTCLTRAIRLTPKFYEAYFFRAALKAKLGRIASAMKDARVCCDVYPQRALCWAAYGYFAVLAHRYETALTSFLLTMKLKRRCKFNWLLVTRGWLFYKWEMFSRAFDDYQILLRRNPRNPHLIKAVALIAWPFKGRPYVKHLLQRYEEVMHENPAIWLLYGLSTFDQADPVSYAKTCQVLQRIIKCYPLHPLTRFNLGVSLWWGGEPACARVMFEILHTPKKPLDLESESAEDEDSLIDELLRIHAYAGLGITLFATAQQARALGILEAVANSGFADAYFFLAFGFIRLAMKKSREAGNAFAKACYLEKFNMEIKFLIGGIYLLFSSAKKAIAFYDVIVKERDSTFGAPALLNRAVAHAQLNILPKALKDIQLVQKLYPEFSKRYRMQVDSLDFQLRVAARKQRTEVG